MAPLSEEDVAGRKSVDSCGQSHRLCDADYSCVPFIDADLGAVKGTLSERDRHA
ncbi:hypothetical protein GCM10023168_19400 [Fodinibacter luteus]|uniref:Uncharacterized protein n=1 Tax=Fodinibacter luteus TaxID=552064 RepID=A0ABP8KFV1_9MICO